MAYYWAQQKAFEQRPDLRCDTCPYKAAEREAGRRWGKRQIRTYCHGGIHPSRKGPREGCAVLWPIWQAIPYYIEMTSLIELRLMDVPSHWTLRDKRLAANIRRSLDDLKYSELRQKPPGGRQGTRR